MKAALDLASGQLTVTTSRSKGFVDFIDLLTEVARI